jgi:hypothetical protein
MANVSPKVLSLLRWLLGISSVCIAAIAVALVMVTHSEPFAVAKEFLVKNPCLSRALGAVESARLSYLGTSQIRAGTTKGYASLTIHVSGKRATATVEVSLVKSLGKWSILSARLTDGHGAGLSNDLENCHP